MSEAEVDLLTRVFSSSRDYAEFGCGGSTVLASSLVGRSIASVDSSKQWLDKVEEACPNIKPVTIHADIGIVGDWGWPTTDTYRDRWANYYQTVWSHYPLLRNADTFLIDGRFRVASFLQVLLMAERNPLIMIHDYQREQYHPVEGYAVMLHRTDNLALFRANAKIDREAIERCLEQHRYLPA